ncbi:MAG: sigma-54 dependent transcriptional regulator [Desulfobacterota bacterium]|nr:sigma-54 dependent transcriptional regulator [Thermodesulfobacteriota bacterium]
MTEQPKILIVDDEQIVRESLANWLQEDGYRIAVAADGSEALQKIKEFPFHIVLLDLKMPGLDGIQVLQAIKKDFPDTEVILMTAYGSVHTAVEAIKAGAYDYIVKPFDPEEVGLLIKKILEHKDLIMENLVLRQKLEEKYEFEDLIGKSAPMQQVFELIRQVAPTQATVLITGESGTGKELVAKAIHAISPRRFEPFIPLSCGALPDTLLESELFGYEKGAFTGAQHTKKGRFEMADGGTLFLDEIGEISLKTQIDLLRVLQEKSFRRLGGTDLIKVDVRIISATNRNLPEAMAQGLFRSDLYYRLNVVNVLLPPLRERREDIPLLAKHFLRRYAIEINKKVERLSPAALEQLMAYPWPGNVRELENAIERAVVITPGHELAPGDFAFLQAAPTAAAGPGPRNLQELEKQHIQKILEENRWNISKSAGDLGIDRVTLYNKIKKYGFERKDH